MKKIKKLVLKKEVVTSLTDSEMNSLQGGAYKKSGLPLSCIICTYGTVYGSREEYKLPDPEPVPYPTQYGGHTAPPRCCAYGCCETIGC